MITEGGQLLEALRELESKEAYAKANQEHSAAVTWAKNAAQKILTEVRYGKHSINNSILLLHTEGSKLSPLERKKIDLLGETWGSPHFAEYVDVCDMGGGDPHESHDWYVCIRTETLIQALTGGDTSSPKINPEKLWELCKKFVTDNAITCPEDILSMEHGREEFVAAICQIVGYATTNSC